MKIIEAIDRIDELKPNTYSQYDKVLWLDQIDGIIKKEIIDTHEDSELVSFTGYDMSTDMDTELIAEEPYDTLYISWLESKIDYMNAEFSKYNNSAAVFNDDMIRYRNYYNRKHMPLTTRQRFF